MTKKLRASTLLTTMLIAAACGGSPEDLVEDDSAVLGRATPRRTVSSASGGGIVATQVNDTPLQLQAVVFYIQGDDALTTITQQAGMWTWSDPVYDVGPRWVYFHYVPGSAFYGVSYEELAGANYAIDLKIDDVRQYQRSWFGDYEALATEKDEMGCPLNNGCLTIAIPGTKLFPFQSTHSIDARLMARRIDDPQPYVRMLLRAPQSPSTYFTERVFPIFQHDRCTTCHSLTTPQAIVTRHNNVFGTNNVIPVQRGNGHRLTCDEHCHFQTMYETVPSVSFIDFEWSTPAADKDIDWRGRTASDICNTVVGNLGGDHEAMKHHFFSDVRIAWAVDNAETPNGRQLDKAPPQNFYDFQSIVLGWIDGNTPCP